MVLLSKLRDFHISLLKSEVLHHHYEQRLYSDMRWSLWTVVCIGSGLFLSGS